MSSEACVMQCCTTLPGLSTDSAALPTLPLNAGPCRADAVVYTSSTSHAHIPATYWLPAVAATLALIFINIISRDDLHNIQESTYGDEHAEVGLSLLCRAPCSPLPSLLLLGICVNVTAPPAQGSL